MSVIVNPGSGPVANATRELAEAAVEQFVADLHVPGVKIEFVKECRKQKLVGDFASPGEMEWVDDGPDGRFEFDLTLDGRKANVEMPGLPVERVRYLGEDDQNIWDFPRLYVNESSWFWKFGLNIARSSLTEDEDGD